MFNTFAGRLAMALFVFLMVSMFVPIDPVVAIIAAFTIALVHKPKGQIL